MRKQFELSDEQFQKIMDACKPTPVMYLSGGRPMFNTPQENANTAWKALGNELGFDGLTVRPVNGKPKTVISAEVTA